MLASKEYKKQVDSNANIYDILDSWGAWAVAGNSSINWQQVADKYKDVVPHGKNCVARAAMMKGE